MAVRWACPAGRHPAVLGPRAPRKDSVVRFCWPCSEAEGRLVARVAPTLERERANAAERKRTAAARRRETAEEAERRAYVVPVKGGEADLRSLMTEAWALLAIRDVRRVHHPRRPVPVIKVIRRNRVAGVSGVAYPAHNQITLCVGAEPDPDELRLLVVHEAAHCALPVRTGHGPRFKHLLLAAAMEAWPVVAAAERDLRPLVITRPAYDLDHAISALLGTAPRSEEEPET